MSLPVRLLGAGVLGVLLLAMLGNAGNQPDVLVAWHGLLLLTALLSWVSATASGTGRRPAVGVSLALVAFTLVVAVGYARAPYPYAAWLTVVEVAAFIAVVLLAVRTGGWLLHGLGPALVLAAWAQTGLLGYQRFALADPRPAGTFLNPNHLAAWLAATVLFAAGRWSVARGDRLARNTLIAALPLMAGIVVTGSRGALVGLAVGCAALATMVGSTFGKRGRRALVASAVLLALMGGTAVALRMRQPDPYRYQRLNIWRAAAMPVMEAPWTGTGPGQFSRAAPNLQFPDGRGALRYDRGFRTTHSDWLRAAAEFGWPGAAVLGWLVVAFSAHAARRRRDDRPVDPGALAALVALFSHGAFDNLTRAPAVYLLGGVFLGLAIGIEGPARRRVRPLWRWLAVGVVVHVFVVAEIAPWRSWSAGKGTGAEALMRRAEVRAGAAPLDWKGYAEVRRLAERAVDAAPTDGELLRRHARIEAAGVLGLYPDRANRERVAGLFVRSEELQRFNPFVPMERAAFLLDTGDPVAARRAAERAIEIEPAAAVPRLLLARAFLDVGQTERAAASLDEAEALAAEHAAEAGAGDYARDLLTLSPVLVAEVRRKIATARQPAPEDPRFAPGQPGG
jgi:O-antigen ligase